MNDYISGFAEYIQGMLEARDALGYAREPHASILRSFDRYCSENKPDCRELTEQLAMSWLLKDSGDTKGIQGRAASIRLLAQYINLSGCAAYVLPERYFGSTKTKDRHIFTDAELSRLFSAIDSLPESGSVPYSGQMLPVLFRLIYTCGLRPQEGRTLKRRNINFDAGSILITNTTIWATTPCRKRLIISISFLKTWQKAAALTGNPFPASSRRWNHGKND